MIIEELKLYEGYEKNLDTFSQKRNLIYSEENTKGKSTYLRLLFYALGYPIPSTKGINFSNIYTEIILVEKGQRYTVRRDKNLLTLLYEDNKVNFTLPSAHVSFLSYIFKYDNVKVLNNLLGFIYVDQDKGWTLLNRGIVIGKIRFNIEELLAGLNGLDIDDLIEKKKSLELNKKKYLALLNIQALSEEVYEKNGEIFVSDIEENLNDKIMYCNIRLEDEKKTLKDIDLVINKDKQFFDYIDSMDLSVQQGDIIIPVNRETLVNSTVNHEYIRAQRSIIVTNIERIKKEKSFYEMKLHDYYDKNSVQTLFPVESEDTIVNKQLANVNIDQTMIQRLLDDTNIELKELKSEIRTKTKFNNEYISKIYKYVFKYAKELEVENKISTNEDYIFTSDLKSLSGAVLQKIVFAFKVAFLKVIEENMDTKLFMVLDSPKGKELDDANMKLIENLIKKELDENQIIIASIYNFEHEKMIKINERAIEGRND